MCRTKVETLGNRKGIGFSPVSFNKLDKLPNSYIQVPNATFVKAYDGNSGINTITDSSSIFSYYKANIRYSCSEAAKIIPNDELPRKYDY